MNSNPQNEIAILEQLEASLRFAKFDSETALAIGTDVVESARAQGKVIEIDIEYEDHCVYHIAMTGWQPPFARWIAGKKTVQKTCGCASMRVYWQLQAEGRKFSEKYPQYTDLDGVAVGGGFPIRLTGDDAIKGWITVTGLPHFEDHELVVNALQRVLGLAPQASAAAASGISAVSGPDSISITSTLAMANGVAIPRFGLGVWSSKPGEETYQAVRWALEAGYRHIDTAEGYSNEADVGRAIRESGIPREEIFVTTKLARGSMGQEKAPDSFARSIDGLGLGYIDLYLIHWPSPETRVESWKYLEKLYAEKKVRAIGVSNYTIRHLEEMKSYASVMPVMNQVELSPFLNQKPLVAWCREHGITVTAYSPLTRGDKMQHPAISAVAARHGKSNAHVMIRWALQSDLVVIPKSVKQERIQDNARVFDFHLDASDMAVLDGLDENYRCNPDWNPENEK